ncbi:MAG: Fe-S cluster assembly ATPase SufC, partial [Bacteroidaceae bacterium]|nr:Fe-S cluster assembly ATPase SufC [Bacteroidaceae bacterium]
VVCLNTMLSVDALRIVAEGFNKLRKPDTSAMVITHYMRLLDYLKPDVVSVMIDGRIVKSGDASLAEKIEKTGFDWIKEEVGL